MLKKFQKDCKDGKTRRTLAECKAVLGKRYVLPDFFVGQEVMVRREEGAHKNSPKHVATVTAVHVHANGSCTYDTKAVIEKITRKGRPAEQLTPYSPTKPTAEDNSHERQAPQPSYPQTSKRVCSLYLTAAHTAHPASVLSAAFLLLRSGYTDPTVERLKMQLEAVRPGSVALLSPFSSTRDEFTRNSTCLATAGVGR